MINYDKLIKAYELGVKLDYPYYLSVTVDRETQEYCIMNAEECLKSMEVINTLSLDDLIAKLEELIDIQIKQSKDDVYINQDE